MSKFQSAEPKVFSISGAIQLWQDFIFRLEPRFVSRLADWTAVA